MIPPVSDSEHPSAAYLVVEIADSSLAKDRGIKRELYAAACMPEYWIINVRAEVIEVHTEPTGSGYAAVTTKHRGDTISLRAFPDITIAVSDILV